MPIHSWREKKPVQGRNLVSVFNSCAYLRSGQAENIPTVARMMGMTTDNAAKLFKRYRQEGLEGFLQLKYIGRRPRLTTEQEHHL